MGGARFELRMTEVATASERRRIGVPTRIVVQPRVARGTEGDTRHGHVSVDAPCRAHPLQHPVGQLRHPPPGVVFENVVAAAEVGEVPRIRRPTLRGILTMVEVAAMDRLAAPDEAAVSVADAQRASDVLGRAISVNGKHAATDGMGEHAIPARRVPGQTPRRLRIDRTVTRKIGRIGSAAEQCERRDRDLDRGTHRSRSRGHVVSDGIRGEQEVSQEIRAQLIHRPIIPSGRLIGRAARRSA